MNALKIGLLALTLSTSLNAAFAGSESGGGGNSSPRPYANKYDVAEAIKVQQFFQGQIFQALLGFAILEQSENRQFKDLALILELSKIVKFDQFIKNVTFRPQSNPCQGETGPSDAAAILPNTVCLSVDRLLTHKYSPEEVLSQITALATHEVLHLMGIPPTRHSEIALIQNFTLNIVGKKSTFSMKVAYTKLADNMTQELAFMNIKANQPAGVVALCTASSQALIAIADAAEDVDLVSEVIQTNFPIGTKADNYLTEAKYRIISAQINGCGMRSADFVFSPVEELYASKSSVSAYDITYSINNAFINRSHSEFSKECGFSGIDCDGEKRILINKIPKHNVQAIFKELQLAEAAYRKYYQIAKLLATQAEELQ